MVFVDSKGYRVMSAANRFSKLQGAIFGPKRKQARNIGVALVLLGIVLALFRDDHWLISISLIAILSALSAPTQIVSSLVGSAARYLGRRGLLVTEDLEREVVRLNLLRIIAGLLLLQRSYCIFEYLVFTQHTSLELFAVCSVMVAGFCLMIGFMTPIAALFLFLFNRQWADAVLGTYTLSTDVMQMILIVLLFAPSGTRLSMDRRVFSSIYRLIGYPSAERITIVKFCAAISFGLLCLYSVMEHSYDDGWVRGYVIAHALTSAATSPHFLGFRQLQAQWPVLFFEATRGLTYLMMAWEYLFIPMLLWTRWSRRIAIFWGFLFICMSSLFLNVQWLPRYEFVLWALLFWTAFAANLRDARALLVFYDDRCNLCDGVVRTLRWLDLFTVIKFKALTLNKDALAAHGVSTNAALTDLIGIDVSNGRIFSGYDLYIELTKRLCLLMPLWPLLSLGKWIGIGPAIYRVVANYRTRVFGICTRSAVGTRSIEDLGRIDRPLVLNAVVVSFVLACSLFAFRLPMAPQSQSATYYSFDVTGLYGLTPISVFNQDALPLAENFFTVSAVSSTGKRHLLPFVGESGENLTWQTWSDRAFMADGLRWRYDLFLSKKEPSCYSEVRDKKVLGNVFAYAKTYYSDIAYFIVGYYHESAPGYEDWMRREPLHFQTNLICSVNVDADTTLPRS